MTIDRASWAYRYGAFTVAVMAIVIGALPVTGRADAPLIEDPDPRMESANGRFFAVPGPNQRSTLVFRRDGSHGRVKLWEMRGWPYAGYLDDDGEYVAAGDWDVQVLRRGYSGDEVIVSFYRRGDLIKSLRVTDILRRPKNLGAPSEAGYHWGAWVGFVGLHRFALETAEGRRLVYDVTTGGLVETAATRPPDTGDPSCAEWLARVSRGAERQPQNRRRDWMVEALAGACTGIRVELRDASVRVRTAKIPLHRGEILAAAAAAVLGPACAVPEPLADAQKLAATCPLPPTVRLSFHPSELSGMRAVDYALLNALLKSLIDARQYDQEAERVALEFALSAQLQGEAERTRTRRTSDYPVPRR